MQVSKRDAVVMLITGAIRALQDGDQVCALTLAGAAEEAMPAQKEVLFNLLKVTIGAMAGGENFAGNALNFQRNWLKHYNVGEPDPVAINGALVIICRAVSRFDACYGREAETEEIASFLEPARKASAEIQRKTSG